jgi:hypothetical protein
MTTGTEPLAETRACCLIKFGTFLLLTHCQMQM